MKAPDKHKERHRLLVLPLLLLLASLIRPGDSTEVSDVLFQLSEKEIYDPQCFDLASLALVKTKKIKIVNSVSELWDFMIFLNKFENPKYSALFWDLSEVFYHFYVKCMQARTHGLGRRQLSAREKNTRSTACKPVKAGTMNKRKLLDEKQAKFRSAHCEKSLVLNMSTNHLHH